MIGLFCFVLAVLTSPFKSNLRLEAENTVLRHQLIVLRSRLHGRAGSRTMIDGSLSSYIAGFHQSCRFSRSSSPETLVRWHRASFRCYWRWKSRPLGGRPQIDTELRVLIRRMSVENPLWGVPRIHGELLKLGFEVAQSSVAEYMVKRRGPPSQGWRTFLHNHAPDIAAMDLFVVPTVGFDLLYGLVIVRLDRRHLVWINVTANPTAEWVARQITEAFPWDEAPHYLIRDRDRIYGSVVARRLRSMGIRDKPTAPACADRVPNKNAHFRSCALTQAGSPDPRNDRICITSSCPRQLVLPIYLPVRVMPTTTISALCISRPDHDGPGHPRNLVGQRHSRHFRGATLHQSASSSIAAQPARGLPALLIDALAQASAQADPAPAAAQMLRLKCLGPAFATTLTSERCSTRTSAIGVRSRAISG